MLNDSKCNLNVRNVKHNQPISNESLISANNGYGSFLVIFLDYMQPCAF